MAGVAHLLGCLFTLCSVGLQGFAVIIIQGYAQRCLLGGEQPQAQHNQEDHYDKQYVCLAKFHACIPVFIQSALKIDPLV